MNKNLILSSLLLSSFLFYSGCMKKEFPNIYPEDSSNNNPSVITETTEITPSPTEVTSQYVPQTKYRQMKTVQGGTITLGEHARGFEFPQYKGKIVLLELFGKECHFCFEEMPTIKKIQNIYQDKLSVIAIQATSPMTKREGARLIQEHNINYPIVDQDEAKSILIYLRDIYQWRGILPYIVLIKDGQIQQSIPGSNRFFKDISEGIEDIIK